MGGAKASTHCRAPWGAIYQARIKSRIYVTALRADSRGSRRLGLADLDNAAVKQALRRLKWRRSRGAIEKHVWPSISANEQRRAISATHSCIVSGMAALSSMAPQAL